MQATMLRAQVGAISLILRYLCLSESPSATPMSVPAVLRKRVERLQRHALRPSYQVQMIDK